MNKTVIIILISINSILAIVNWKIGLLNYNLLSFAIDFHQENLKKATNIGVNPEYIMFTRRAYLLRFFEGKHKLDSLYNTNNYFEKCESYLHKYQFRNENNQENRVDTTGYKRLLEGELKNCEKCKQVYFKENEWHTLSGFIEFAYDYDFFGLIIYNFFRESFENNCDQVFYGTSASHRLKHIHLKKGNNPIITYDDHFKIDISKFHKDSLEIYYPNEDYTKLIRSRVRWY